MYLLNHSVSYQLSHFVIFQEYSKVLHIYQLNHKIIDRMSKHVVYKQTESQSSI